MPQPTSGYGPLAAMSLSSEPGVVPADSSSPSDPPEKLYADWEPEQMFSGLRDYFQQRNAPPENLTGLEELLAKTTLEDKTNEPKPQPSKSFWASFFGDILFTIFSTQRSLFGYIFRVLSVLGGMMFLVLSVLGSITYSILVHVGSVILFTPFILGNIILLGLASALVMSGKFIFANILSYGVSMRKMLARHFKKWGRTYATVVVLMAVLMAVGHLVFRFWQFELVVHYSETGTSFSISVSPVSAIVSPVRSQLDNAMSQDI